MDLLTSQNVIAGITGLVTGAVGSLVAPWVQWAIEKRRKKVERRQDQIDRWRDAIADHEGDIREFGAEPEYAAMKEHMDPGVVEKWESETFFASSGGGRGGEPRRKMLLDQVAQIEREWDLV